MGKTYRKERDEAKQRKKYTRKNKNWQQTINNIKDDYNNNDYENQEMLWPSQKLN